MVDDQDRLDDGRLRIARIVGVHGLKGAVRLKLFLGLVECCGGITVGDALDHRNPVALLLVPEADVIGNAIAVGNVAVPIWMRTSSTLPI